MNIMASVRHLVREFHRDDAAPALCGVANRADPQFFPGICHGFAIPFPSTSTLIGSSMGIGFLMTNGSPRRTPI